MNQDTDTEILKKSAKSEDLSFTDKLLLRQFAPSKKRKKASKKLRIFISVAGAIISLLLSVVCLYFSTIMLTEGSSDFLNRVQALSLMFAFPSAFICFIYSIFNPKAYLGLFISLSLFLLTFAMQGYLY